MVKDVQKQFLKWVVGNSYFLSTGVSLLFGNLV